MRRGRDGEKEEGREREREERGRERERGFTSKAADSAHRSVSERLERRGAIITAHRESRVKDHNH